MGLHASVCIRPSNYVVFLLFFNKGNLVILPRRHLSNDLELVDSKYLSLYNLKMHFSFIYLVCSVSNWYYLGFHFYAFYLLCS